MPVLEISTNSKIRSHASQQELTHINPPAKESCCEIYTTSGGFRAYLAVHCALGLNNCVV
jgi:hypothetical protein